MAELSQAFHDFARRYIALRQSEGPAAAKLFAENVDKKCREYQAAQQARIPTRFEREDPVDSI